MARSIPTWCPTQSAGPSIYLAGRLSWTRRHGDTAARRESSRYMRHQVANLWLCRTLTAPG
ncbi:hypothetical protein B0T26DRAFT_689532, partial [Lasiosphaeria miniovina]